MTKIITIISFLIFPLLTVLSQEIKSEVVIISTVHGAHKINPNYSYQDLFSFIEKFNPDVIGVEIRKEDLDSSTAYLEKYYPFEMYEVKNKFPSKKIVGFDWLGEDLEGKTIPNNYWNDISALKKLQQKLSEDSIILKKLSILEIIKEEKNELALHSTLQELNNGRYDFINHVYYEQLEELLKDTPYTYLSTFYQQRDEHIAQNIIQIIKNNPGKRMIFLIGADHRDYTLKRVNMELGNSINFIPLSEILGSDQ